MKRSIGMWQLMGFAVTSFLGTILHFLYEWTNESIFVAPFSGVNESTWEHMKLLFWPMLIYAVIQSFFFGDRQNFWCVKLHGILLGLGLIPILFYTYNGVIGKSPDFVNIAIFFIALAITYIYETKQFNKEKPHCKNPKFALGCLVAIGIMFVIFTFKAPNINLFKDPLTGSYGISEVYLHR